LAALAQGELSFDQLLESVQQHPAQLAEDLARHQLAGHICSCPGDRFRLASLPTDRVGG
jgi:predicted Rossmann fold nucleotide-binding protein DprA/Smf involved in DNA uptake